MKNRPILRIAILMAILLAAAGLWAADQRIQYTEEMVGAGHGTKSDTLNRLTLVEHENDGTHKSITLGEGKSVHDTDADTKIQVEESADEDKIRLDVGGTEAAILDADGLRLPLQPSFQVNKSATQSNVATGSEVTITFDTEVFDVGGDFASNTFTAPVTGRYLLTANLVLGQVDTAATWYRVSIITTKRTYIHIFDPARWSADVTYWTVPMAVVADMDASETAYVTIYQTAGTAQTDIMLTDTFFSGQLIS